MSSMRWPRELLQAGRHRRVRLIAALLAFAPDALVLANARPPALLALAPLAVVLTDTARLLLRGASFCLGLTEPPPFARAAPGCRRLCGRGALLTVSLCFCCSLAVCSLS